MSLSYSRVAIVAPERVEFQSASLSEPERGEVQVEMVLSLVSAGTELVWLGGRGTAWEHGAFSYPIYPGYAAVGRVRALGEGAQMGLEVGELVLTMARHASAANVSESSVLRVPEGLDPALACFAVHASVAMHGVRHAEIELGDAVVVLGLGVIGNLAGQLARLNGAKPVIGVDLDASRLRVARDGGWNDVTKPEGLDEHVILATGGRGADVVIDATGAVDSALSDAFRVAAICGKVVLLGGAHAEVTLDLFNEFQLKELRLIGCSQPNRPDVPSSYVRWTKRRQRELALELIARAELDVKRLVTHRFDAADVEDAYQCLQAPEERGLGVLLEWER